jgi:hypothetical protein
LGVFKVLGVFFVSILWGIGWRAGMGCCGVDYGTKMTALRRSFEWYHCHPATATRWDTVGGFILFFLIKHGDFYNTSQLPPSHSHRLYLVPFEPR